MADNGWVGSPSQKKQARISTCAWKSASCNLSSLKLLISVRVLLRSLSTPLHLHKIKDARFLCHCLSIERGPLSPDATTLACCLLARLRSVYQRTAGALSQRAPGGGGSFLWRKPRDNAGTGCKTANELEFFLQTCTWLKLNQSVLSRTLSSCYCSYITNPELQGIQH